MGALLVPGFGDDEEGTAKKKEYLRGEEQTFLALPEWYIVFNSDEYADFLRTHLPSRFPYLASALEFWKLKGIIERVVSPRYELNLGYEWMLYVIGTSYSVELVLKGLYENLVGAWTERIAGPTLTNADRIIREKHQAYADFVHIYPWYEFDFFSHLRDFWSRTATREGSFLRFWERRLFFGFEYLFKSGYGWLIKKGTQAGYEPEAATVFAIAEDDGKTLERFNSGDRLKVLVRDGTQALLELKRYDEFRETVKALSNSGVRFLEISGNHTIFLTVIRDRSRVNPLPRTVVSGLSAVPTDPRKERLLITVPVGSLVETVARAMKSAMTIEHVFDY